MFFVRAVFLILLTFYLCFPACSIEANNDNLLIILDSSYSMSEQLNGRTKLDIAKNVIIKVLGQSDSNTKLGLRVYGHKSGFLGFGACSASELIVPIGPNTRQKIFDQIKYIQPVGATPITYSLEQAIMNDFTGLTGKRRIILLSDGMETCHGSPCDYVVSLVKKNVEIKIDVIGFDIYDKDAISQLKCVALSTRGRFYSASNEEELSDSFLKSFNSSKEVQGTILRKN